MQRQPHVCVTALQQAVRIRRVHVLTSMLYILTSRRTDWAKQQSPKARNNVYNQYYN